MVSWKITFFFWRFSQLSTSISFGEFPTSHIYLKILICSSIFYYISFKKKWDFNYHWTSVRHEWSTHMPYATGMPLSELRGADLDPPANPSAIFFCPPDLPHRCLRSFDHSLTGWGPTVMFVGLQTLIIPINYSHIYHKTLLSHL